MKRTSKAYKLIEEYYGDKTTKRSGVRLMNHIDEGLEILDNIGATDIVKDAYCLHPILQSDEDFNNNLKMDYKGIDIESILLAIEYRRVANSYLSTMTMDSFVGFTNEEIKQMLYADKVQNEKDFKIYHEGTHPRSKELREYFDNWLNVLLKDEDKCPNCGENENIHTNYDWYKKDRPVEEYLCNECGTYFKPKENEK